MTTEITRIIEGFKEFSETPYEDSIRFLNEYIEVEPTDEAFFELGKALFLNEDYDESIRYLKKTDDFKADAYLGLNHYRKNDFQNAIIHFERFLKEKQNETILSYLMLSYEKNKDFKNAVRCGEKLLEINPKNDSIKVHLVDYHFNLCEYERSLSYLNEFHDKKFRYKRGLVLFKLKKYEEAIRKLKDIKTTESYRLMSKCYEKLNKPSNAIRCLTKAYEKDPDIEILFEIAEITMKSRYTQRTISIFEWILAVEGENESVLERIVRSCLELYEFELAKMYCEELIKINENNINAYILMAEIYPYYDGEGKFMEYVEKGLEINPKSAELWVQKAWGHYLYDFDEFLKCYEHALKLEPNNTENYTKIIWYCAFEDRLDDARRYYEKLLFYNPAFAESFEEVTEYAIE